ncbi:MAG: type II toxin-antitoxin system HicB family antitoxin [Candidatus Kerfeldbacteria bacterium]|nr:type II toxin-antitoxin system HicB family antitoxin [Candidatus Kerfeldbacteria bacterium]
MQDHTFTIVLEPDHETGGYNVVVPSLPGCFTQGDTIEEACQNAKEAIQCHLEGLKIDGIVLSYLTKEAEFVSTVSIPVAYA